MSYLNMYFKSKLIYIYTENVILERVFSLANKSLIVFEQVRLSVIIFLCRRQSF